MATIRVVISIILLCITIAQGRKPLNTSNEFSSSSLVDIHNDDGICKVMVETQGYICEEHKVITKDGYILSLQRLPAGRSGKRASKPPVIVQHGLLCDANIWLVNSPDQSLGFILADSGFDVWLFNGRGTRSSNKHRSLTPNDMAYWEWSWDELVSYDLPSSVEYVYNYTGQKMHYAGHSQGSLIACVSFSEDKLVNMLRSAALLSPIAHMNLLPPGAIQLAATDFLADLAYWGGIRQFIPNAEIPLRFLHGICLRLGSNCVNLMSPFTGLNCCLNSSRLNFYLEYEPQPTSTKSLIHFSQMIRKGNIAKYDYVDASENLKHYGQLLPPTYDMSKISKEFPLFIGHGGQDLLSYKYSVKAFIDDLGHNADKLVVVFMPDYAHADFIMGLNAKQDIYDPMIKFFDSY